VLYFTEDPIENLQIRVSTVNFNSVCCYLVHAITTVATTTLYDIDGNAWYGMVQVVFRRQPLDDGQDRKPKTIKGYGSLHHNHHYRIEINLNPPDMSYQWNRLLLQEMKGNTRRTDMLAPHMDHTSFDDSKDSKRVCYPLCHLLYLPKFIPLFFVCLCEQEEDEDDDEERRLATVCYLP
jgi:hypothetical protein